MPAAQHGNRKLGPAQQANALPKRLPGPVRDMSGSLFEACERRLVLSAQLLFDVLGDQALQMHDSPQLDHLPTFPEGTCQSPIAGELSDSGLPHPSVIGWIPTETQLQEAHQATGWNEVQSQYGLSGKGQTVAVIDSGIAWDHVALGGGFGPGYRVVGGWDFTEENDAQPYDDGPMGFHGTHVSGIIGSSDATHTGVAPEVDLVGLRVFNDLGQGQLAWVEQALNWVHENQNSFENPITTVNLSLGTNWNADTIPEWATLEEEFRLLYEDGIVVTASAGNSFAQFNESGLSYPAASPYVLPVASVDDDGQLSDFSQRHSRALAAPGGNIVSTVPDHVLGTDGNVNDFSTASGTSMSAPYVAGASVLVREAMQMVGLEGINLTKIADHLRATSDSIYDAATGANYDRLDLQAAIDALIPADQIGDTASTAGLIDLGQSQIGGWLNSVSDVDVYSFTATASGSLSLSATSEWVDSLSWSLHTGGNALATSSDAQAVQLLAGQSYELRVQAGNEIGPFALGLDFSPSSGGETEGGSSPPASGGPITSLGEVRYLHDADASSGTFQVQAVSSGTLTVQWDAEAGSGELRATTDSGASAADSDWSDGLLRVDLEVQAGQWVQFATPGTQAVGELSIANVLSIQGNSAVVTGTDGSDNIMLDLSQGAEVRFENIAYALPAGISQLNIDSHVSNDSLQVVGSPHADKVDLRPTGSVIENQNMVIHVSATEQIDYTSGGGRDRVYLYDSDQDDTLRAYPRSAELTGVGYNFSVEDIDRIFIHATGGGQDFAYLYDSDGNDRLSMRPQFSSLSGDGFFNYVRGFERVYAYANAGGVDEAMLYDSAGDDRFSTSGASASIVGPGFSSFSRSFESVEAISEAGGTDLATLYGNSPSVNWQQGSDYVSMQDGQLQRQARGFHTVDTYLSGQPHALGASDLGASGVGASDLHSSDQSVTAIDADTTDSAARDSGVRDSSNPAHAAPFQGIPAVQAAAHVSQRGDHADAAGLRDRELVWPETRDGQAQAIHDTAEEQALLDSLHSLGDWLADREDSAGRLAENIELPDARFMDDSGLEQSLLDEVFRQFDRNS